MMLKRSLLLVFVGLMVFSGHLIAQEQETDEAAFAAVTVYVQQIFPHSRGFMVTYNRSDLYRGEVFLPGSWFTAAAGRAEMVYSNHPSAPYMTVFFENGEFSHLRLFAHANPGDRSWGALPSGQDFEEEFSVETLEMQF
jgi:hypothetical protein